MTEPVQIGDATLYCGDCLEILPGIKHVNCVITDPPYDATTHTGYRVSDGKDRIKNKINFAELETKQFVNDALEICDGWIVIFASLAMLGEYQKEFYNVHVRMGIWDKLETGAPQFSGDRPAQTCEGISILHRSGKKQYTGRPYAIWRHPVNRKNIYHPTEKPVGLLRELVDDFSSYQDTILDPFMGSATTGVACIQRGRKFIGIEREREHFDIACDRIEKAYAQGILFEPEPPKLEQQKIEI